MTTYGETPATAHVSNEWHDKLINAHLVVGDQELMGADSPPEMGGALKQGFCVSIQIIDEKKARHIFEALSDGGRIVVPFEETFWAKRFGMVTDKFGTPWMVACANAG
jgi:PhnB protein